MAAVTVALSVLVSFLGAKMEIMPLSLLSKWLAVAAVASHLWFAILKTRYVGALYMFIAWRWGSSASPEVRTVRTWARRIATGTVGAWAVAAMVAPPSTADACHPAVLDDHRGNLHPDPVLSRAISFIAVHAP